MHGRSPDGSAARQASRSAKLRPCVVYLLGFEGRRVSSVRLQISAEHKKIRMTYFHGRSSARLILTNSDRSTTSAITRQHSSESWQYNQLQLDWHGQNSRHSMAWSPFIWALVMLLVQVAWTARVTNVTEELQAAAPHCSLEWATTEGLQSSGRVTFAPAQPGIDGRESTSIELKVRLALLHKTNTQASDTQ